jgi:hypothetical protein
MKSCSAVVMSDISLRGLEKSQHRYYGKKEQPDPLGVVIGLRAPEEGGEFFHQGSRGSYADWQMQSFKILKTGHLQKRERRLLSQAASLV